MNKITNTKSRMLVILAVLILVMGCKTMGPVKENPRNTKTVDSNVTPKPKPEKQKDEDKSFTAKTPAISDMPPKSALSNETTETAQADDLSLDAVIAVAKRYAQGGNSGARVLNAGIKMIDKGTIIKGGCWDYVNQVYINAGFPADKRGTVFMQSKERPYADLTLIKPGDWIMFDNLTYESIGHSAIFVNWIDFNKRSALTIEYAGLNREIPGRYREYDITKCFGILRGME